MKISENSSYLSCLDTGSIHDNVHRGFCVAAVTSHLNTIVLDPVSPKVCDSLLAREEERKRETRHTSGCFPSFWYGYNSSCVSRRKKMRRAV